MFERFTSKARTVVISARAKAAERGDDQIRPVYLLHGLVAAGGVAARTLASLGVDAAVVEREIARTAPLGNPVLAGADSGDAEALAAIGIDLEEIKRKIEENFGPGALERLPATRTRLAGLGGGRITFTRESKLVLALALRQARALHHNYLGTEHLLLGLLAIAERQPRGDLVPETSETPAVLRDLGLDVVTVRDQVLAALPEAQRS